MSESETNIPDLIQRRMWTADTLMTQIKTLLIKASSLDNQAKKNVPKFAGDWSGENFALFVEKLNDSVRNPIRHRNRAMLEELGIQTKGIPDEILEDTSGALDFTHQLGELDSSTTLVKFAIGKGIVSDWIREGFASSCERLRQMSITQKGLESIIADCPDIPLRDGLLVRSIQDPSYVGDAQDIVSRVKYMSARGIQIPVENSFEKAIVDLNDLWKILWKLSDEFGISDSEIDEITKGRQLGQVRSLLEEKATQVTREKAKLEDEWLLYAEALTSVESELPEMPQKMVELREGVDRLEKECLDTLGSGGMAVLAYLKGESEFPDTLTLVELKRSIEVLRPLFMKSLRKEQTNAGS